MICKNILLLFAATNLLAFDIVLDIGHTPSKAGAVSATCEKEYNYNRALSLYIMDSLKNNNNITLSLSSQYQKHEMSFQDRYQSSIGKDLFISIHHDSVQKQFLHLNADGCPTSNYASGFSIFISRKNPYFAQSLLYAKKLGNGMLIAGFHPSLHHAENIAGENRELLDSQLGIYIFDDLKVLKNSKSPAILLEAGVIVNPAEEMNAKTTIYKEKISKAIAHTYI
jgi:N-acetylmuramoyl-L-alanine amidase